jgi:hypothetical protein
MQIRNWEWIIIESKTFTVGELIEKLKEYPTDWEIGYSGDVEGNDSFSLDDLDVRAERKLILL